MFKLIDYFQRYTEKVFQLQIFNTFFLPSNFRMGSKRPQKLKMNIHLTMIFGIRRKSHTDANRDIYLTFTTPVKRRKSRRRRREMEREERADSGPWHGQHLAVERREGESSLALPRPCTIGQFAIDKTKKSARVPRCGECDKWSTHGDLNA